MTQTPETLADVLRRRAESRPERDAYRFLSDDEAVAASATYGELDFRARVIGQCLRSVVGAGERVLLLYPPGLEYVAAFFGCLYAGAVAVPAYPPRLNRNARRLQAIAADAQASVALTAPQSLKAVEALFGAPGQTPLRRVIDTTSLPGQLARDWGGPDADPESLALIQYTSGSTGDPRGVMLSHANLTHNSRLLQSAFEYDEGSRCVSWLPMYHDMGLIGGVIQPLYGGYSCTLMSPTTFLQSPLRWLRAITRERATISGGPNFAYDLCVRKSTPEQRAGLDLSSWEVAFNGSEPIRHETLERFRAAFAPSGFRARAFFPCYGLAEATLIVSGGPKGSGLVARAAKAEALERHEFIPAGGEEEEETRALVASGACLPGQDVRIVEPETGRLCASGRVGEIWVSGGSVARGYWNNGPATEQTFRATLAETNEGPFLRTGDLGVMLDGQLFVTGRLKDLIIIRGLNYYPQDIELTVEKCHPSFPPNAGAAFAVERGGEERLVVVQEVRRLPPDAGALFASVRQAIVAEHGIEPAEIVFVRYGDVPKTSSGKIQRRNCREAYLAGALRVVGARRGDAPGAATTPAPPKGEPDGGALEGWLKGTLAALVGASVEDFPADAEIGSAGLDSLKAVSLVQLLEENLGVRVSLSEVMQGMTLEDLARECLARMPQGAAARSVAAHAEPQGSPPRDGEAASYPLSYGQRGFWFLNLSPATLSPDNIHIAARLRQRLDVPALRASFVKLALRHEALRTAYVTRQGSPSQHARAEAPDFFDEVDASGWGAGQMRERLSREIHHRFDLEGEPLLRVRLFRHGPAEHTLLLVVHHSVADMWSLAIIARELGVCYEAELRGTPAALPPQGASYRDFVRWQSELVGGPRGEELWSYWRAQLSGEPPTLNLPTDRPRPAAQGFRGATVRAAAPPALTLGLKALSEKNGTSLYVTLLATFQLLLHRYTGQDEQFVGSPVTGRTQAEWNDVVGYFVNVLPLRARFDGRASFDELHRQLGQTVWEALEHQDYPFNLLVERLNPRRDLSRAPLVQAMFVFQNIELEGNRELAGFALGEEGARLELGGLNLESLFVEKQATRFDLMLFVADTPRGLSCAVEYDADIFERTSVERLHSHWLNLLEAVVRDPAGSLHTLPLLSDSERRQLLVEWNDTSEPPPDVPLVQQPFRENARLHPQAPAVVCGARTYSYGQLQGMALKVARRLRRCGVYGEARVGVMMRRGAGLVAALLGILEAGAAYLPLDEQYPAERIEYMLRDGGAQVLVCGSAQAEKWRGKVREVLVIDEEEGLGADGADEDSGGAGEGPGVTDEESGGAAGGAAGERLAYVIYTSGSTGRPKGVAITHRSASAFLRWAGTRFTPHQLAGTLFSTSICFDLSVFEIFAPLSYGGKIIVAENALELPRLPAASEVTLLNTVPSAMAELLSMKAVPDGVEVVNLAGEALPRTLVTQLYQLPTVRQVFNLYGPTEDTTYTTCEAVPRELTCNPAIGRPVADTQIYLLNRALQPVPVGVAGELYIGGCGLARGYLNRPGLTAEKFVPDPFGASVGARLYRTGDLARYLADGRIEYLGRIDQQVKLRGFRIELGEIEAALLEHSAVRAAAVEARASGDLEKRLVAYLVTRDGQEPPAAELRAHLKTKLPEHMLPQEYVWLPELPLTPNGKVDRRALPAPPTLRAGGAAGNYLAPRTRTEELLADIWRQVLRVERVGVEDDFFDLGGHSLLATQVALRIREACQVEVPILSLFESPTVARLAEVVDERRGLRPTAGTEAIKLAPRITRRLKVTHDAAGNGRL